MGAWLSEQPESLVNMRLVFALFTRRVQPSGMPLDQ